MNSYASYLKSWDTSTSGGASPPPPRDRTARPATATSARRAPRPGTTTSSRPRRGQVLECEWIGTGSTPTIPHRLDVPDRECVYHGPGCGDNTAFSALDRGGRITPPARVSDPSTRVIMIMTEGTPGHAQRGQAGWQAAYGSADSDHQDAGWRHLRRPLHFIILADCSWGMKGEKIQALNYAIADMMPHLADWERDQEQAQVFVRAVAFATEPRWHIPDPSPVASLRWKPLQPVTQGADQHGCRVRDGRRGPGTRPDRAQGAAAGPAADHRRAGHRPARQVRGGPGDPDGPARGPGRRAAVHRDRPGRPVRRAEPVHRRPQRPGAGGQRHRGHRGPSRRRVPGRVQDVRGRRRPHGGGAPAVRRRECVRDRRSGHDPTRDTVRQAQRPRRWAAEGI